MLSCGTSYTPAGRADAGGSTTLCNFTPTDLQSDLHHCGSCDHACFATEVCSSGTCTCPTGRSLCGTQCRDLSADVETCGSCHTTCKAGESCCGGQCGDPQTTYLHCGSCGHACGNDETCADGVCVPCPEGTVGCAGKCTVLATDANNCGVCGRACKAGFQGGEAYCSMGRCVEQMDKLVHSATWVAAMGSELVYASVLGIYKMPKTGGAGAVLVSSAASEGFALEGGFLYFAGPDYTARLSRVAVPGGGVSTVAVFPAGGSLAVGGGYGYLALHRAPIGGGPVVQVMAPPSVGTLNPLDADGTYAYYGDHQGVLRVPHQGPVVPERIASGNVGQIFRGTLVNGGMVLRADWQILARATFGAGITILTTNVQASVVSGSTLYYVTPDDPVAPQWRLMKMPAAGGDAEIIAERLPDGVVFAVDASGAYLLAQRGPRAGYWRIHPL